MKKNRGFTLMEMLIVIAIIAVLVSVAIPVFVNAKERAARSVDLANARSIQAVLATLVMEGEIEFSEQAAATGRENGVWVLVCRDRNAYPSDYAKNANTTVFCGTDAGVTVSGEKSSGWNSGNTALYSRVTGSLGGDSLRVYATQPNRKLHGLGGWDWYIVQYCQVGDRYVTRIYSGFAGNKSAFNATTAGSSNMEQYIAQK